MTEVSSSRSPADDLPWWPVAAVGALALYSWFRPATPASSGEAETGDAAASGTRSSSSGSARGQDADTPLEIPLVGWKDIALRTYEGIGEDRLLAVAAGVTFYALLAIFPAMAALISIYGLFADPASIAKHLDAVSGFMPGGAIDILGEQVKRLTSTPSGSLSLALVTSLALSLWSANAGMKAIFDALNVAYREKEERGFVALTVRSLTFTLGALLFIILALASVVVLPVVLNFVGFGDRLSLVLDIARWPLLLALIIAGLAVLYRYGPSRAVAKWRWIGWGSGIAAVLWVAASMLFSFYVSHFGSYNATYGSLGSAIGFMTWIWVSSIIILLGAELSGEMEHQTEKDTTTGSPRPMGTRGAYMADHVGKTAGS